MTRTSRFLVAGITALLSLAASSQAPKITLKLGLYARASVRCNAAANADILTWDGYGIGGAHTSKCSTVVRSQKAGHLNVETTCTAQGDGTPNPGDKPYVEADTLTQLSDQRFTIGPANAAKPTYRWCSAMPLK